MKKTIRDFDLANKKVIIRVDFNVPIKNNVITDDNRIKESLATIEYAIEKEAKVILMSHLGRVKKTEDKETNSLLAVSVRLSELMNKQVNFVPFTKGIEVEQAVQNMQNGDILLLENTRFEDLEGNKESGNDKELGEYWASLGDIFINDAFGTSHRAHASNVGIGSILPNGIGFLVEKELGVLTTTISNPKRPFTVILGGAKIADKIGVIKNLVSIADYILIGGGMSYTFLKSQGLEIGKSLLDEASLPFCKEMLEKYPNKIILPTDIVTGIEFDNDTTITERFVTDIKSNEMGMDIGTQSIKLFKQYIDASETIIWNGPVGVFEMKNFAKGTISIFELLKNSSAFTIIGGGDTASAAINFGYKDSFDYISTGGGASLELLEGKTLPGVDVINEK